jgi:type I restriction enzyme S subunit
MATQNNNSKACTERSRSVIARNEAISLKELASIAPKLRFKEFVGKWGEYRIDNTFSFFNGYAFSSSDAKNSGTKWVKIADVGINKMKETTPSFLPDNYVEKYKKFILKKGDYVIALTRPILNGKLKIARINDSFNNALLNQRVGKVISNNHLEFIYNLLQKNSLISRIEDRIAGTDPPNLSPNEIGSIRVNLPKLPEQQKIASFLTAVDTKLQQLTTKREKLSQYKKGVMQQLFPSTRSGQVAQLRFKPDVIARNEAISPNEKEFPDWEEKKLGEVGEIIGGGTPDTTNIDYWDGDIQWFTPTEVSKKYIERSKRTITPLGLKKSSARILPKGTILFTSRATIAELSFATEECTTNQGFQSIVVNANNNSGFVYYWINNNKKAFIRKSQGSTFLEISKNEIKKIKILIPSLKEQQKIANYLSAIDTKIEAVQTQITNTQAFKKGLLQQMFV